MLTSPFSMRMFRSPKRHNPIADDFPDLHCSIILCMFQIANRLRNASMNPGAWWFNCLFFCTFANATMAIALAAQDDTAAKFVSEYQTAYAQGQDLVPASQTPLDTSSLATRLHLQTIRPQSALGGSAFLASDGTVVKLAGAQGCLSTEQIAFAGLQATCAMISLAGLIAVLAEAKAAAGDAFPCHVLGQNRGTPPVHYAECFFNKDGAVQSISETLIGRGLAFAARDRAGWPIFPDYAKVEEDAHRKRVGIWANTYFVHPYGERHRANPSMK